MSFKASKLDDNLERIAVFSRGGAVWSLGWKSDGWNKALLNFKYFKYYAWQAECLEGQTSNADDLAFHSV